MCSLCNPENKTPQLFQRSLYLGLKLLKIKFRDIKKKTKKKTIPKAGNDMEQ